MSNVSSENAIEIRGLRKHFPGFDLGPLDLVVPRGSIYGFVGPNGAGKSTTIDLIFGMGMPDAGEIKVCGLDVNRNEVAVKKRIAYVSPEIEFSPWGVVKNAIRFVRGFYLDSWDDDLCEELLNQFDLNPKAKIMTLSFGSKMKLSLVLALSRRPEILILDEPTTGLDAIAKQELFSQLLSLVQDSERTILISSHSLSDVERFADHLGIIRNGLMLHEGAMNSIVDRYCLVDFEAGEIARQLEVEKSIHVVDNKGGRIRVLVDREKGGIEFLKAKGLSNISQSPVTLEDLFVSLLKNCGERGGR